MGDIHIVARNPGVTLDDFVAYLAEDPIGALDGATLAERDAEIANLERWRDALIKQTSEQIAEIAALRAQVAELEATLAAVRGKAQKFDDIAEDWQKLADEKPEDSPKSGGFARISSVYAVCAAELREAIGID